MDNKIILGYIAFGTLGIAAGIWLSNRSKAKAAAAYNSSPNPTTNAETSTTEKLALAKKPLTIEEAMYQAAGIQTNRGRIRLIKRTKENEWD